MTKFVLFLFLLTSLTLDVAAQDLQYGPEIGPNFNGATIHTQTSASGTPGLGIQLGGFVEVPLTDNLSLRPRLLISYERYVPNLYGGRYAVRMTFLKIPIDLVYRPATMEKWFFGLGPYVAPCLSGREVAKDGSFNDPLHFGSDANNDQAKRSDLGLDLVAGYQLTDKILLTANFDFGIINILNTNYYPGSSAHVLSLGITAAYLLRPGKAHSTRHS